MRKNIVFVFCIVIMLFNKGDTFEYKEVKFNNGYGVLFSGGRLLTAFHLVKEDNILLYCDKDKDIAVVDLSENDEFLDKKDSKNFDKGVVKTDKTAFLYIEWLIDKGDSGKAYIKDGKLLGIFIGRKEDKAVVSVISDEVLNCLIGGD